MAAGLWVFDPAGNLIMGPGSSTLIATNAILTGTTSGSIYDAMFEKGLPAIISATPVSGGAMFPPHLTFNYAERRLVWTFEGYGSTNHRIIYGVAA